MGLKSSKPSKPTPSTPNPSGSTISISTLTPSPLVDLSVELLLLVCEYLPAYGLVSLGGTCHALHNVLNDAILWRGVYVREFGRPIDVIHADETSTLDILSLGCQEKGITLLRLARSKPWFAAEWKAWGVADVSVERALDAAARGDLQSAFVWWTEASLALWWGQCGDERRRDVAASCRDAWDAWEESGREEDGVDERCLVARMTFPGSEFPDPTASIGVSIVDGETGEMCEGENGVSVGVLAHLLAGFVDPVENWDALRAGAMMFMEAAENVNRRGVLVQARSVLTCAANAGAAAHGNHVEAYSLNVVQEQLIQRHSGMIGSTGRLFYLLGMSGLLVGEYADAARYFAAYAGSAHANRIRYSADDYWSISVLATALASNIAAAREALIAFGDTDERYREQTSFEWTARILTSLDNNDAVSFRETYQGYFIPNVGLQHALSELSSRFFFRGEVEDLFFDSYDDSGSSDGCGDGSSDGSSDGCSDDGNL